MTKSVFGVCWTHRMSAQNGSGPWWGKAGTRVIHCTILQHLFFAFFPLTFIFSIFITFFSFHTLFWSFSIHSNLNFLIELRTFYFFFSTFFSFASFALSHCAPSKTLPRPMSSRCFVLLIIEMAKMKEQPPISLTAFNILPWNILISFFGLCYIGSGSKMLRDCLWCMTRVFLRNKV